MTKILIINPGVQPELQKGVTILDTTGFNVKYATASSFGREYGEKFFTGGGWISQRFGRIYKRRILEFSDELVVRYGFPLELASYFLFRFFGKHCRPIRNFYFYLKLFFYTIGWKPQVIIFQDSIPLAYRMSRTIRLSIKVLVVSTASPMYFESVFTLEKVNNKEWSRFFLSSGFSKHKQMKYLQDSNFADYVVTPSDFVARDLSNYIDNRKIRVIRLGHNLQSLGVDSTDLRNPRDSRIKGLRIIFVGQLSQRKGISYLLDGFFAARIPNDSVLTLVGTSVLGSSSYILKKYNSIQLSLKGHLSRSELGELLAKHDLFIMPSLIEGFCLSAVEALGTGIPVAVTDVVLDDIVINNTNGYIIDKFSSTSISQLLERLCDDKDGMVHVGRNGSELASKYTWNQYREEFVKFVFEISSSRSNKN